MSVETKNDEITQGIELSSAVLLNQTRKLLDAFTESLLKSSELATQLSLIFLSAIPFEQQQLDGSHSIPFQRGQSLYWVEHTIHPTYRFLQIERNDIGYGVVGTKHERARVGFRKWVKNGQENFNPWGFITVSMSF